jgi:hypothetical protein
MQSAGQLDWAHPETQTKGLTEGKSS